ncbi:DUF4430 domain-containing protein [Sporosarcina sp. CAU 1771]
MKNAVKLLRTLFVIALMLFVLSACGASLQKPTGLEKPIELEETPGEDLDEDEIEKVEVVPVESEESPVAETKVDSKVEDEKPSEPVEVEKKTADQVKNEEKIEKKPSEPSKPISGGTGTTSKPSVDDKKPPVEAAPKPPPPAEKPTEKPAEPEKVPEPPASTVTYSVVISGSEVPLAPTKVEISDGDTVLKALINITKKHKIQMDYRGGQGGTGYIEGIANVYEFDRGQGSGWMYRVNGIFPDRGAGAVKLQAGDRVEWLYTTNLGEDLNANLQPFRR